MTNIPLAIFGLQGPEIMLLGVVVLLFFGGAKIPQLMRGVGRGVGELQEGLKEGRKKLDEAMKDTDDDDTRRVN